jgi:hypothetical protein
MGRVPSDSNTQHSPPAQFSMAEPGPSTHRARHTGRAERGLGCCVFDAHGHSVHPLAWFALVTKPGTYNNRAWWMAPVRVRHRGSWPTRCLAPALWSAPPERSRVGAIKQTRSKQMPRDVNSPINSSYIGSRLANSLPLSPGARSMPRGNRGRRDSEPEQSAEPREQPARAEQSPVSPRTKTTGPED